MTMRCHFMLKSVFIVDLLRFFCLAFRDTYVKTNEDTPTLSATKCSPGTAVSSGIKFMRIFATVLARGDIN